MRNTVAYCRSRSQGQVDNTELGIQAACSLLCYQLADAGNLESSFLNSFGNHTDIAVTHLLQRIFNNTRSAYANVDNAFRFGYAMEGTCHERVIRHSVAEYYQLSTTDCITVSGTLGSSLYNLAHLFYSVHVDTAFGRTNAYRGADNVGNCQCFRNRSNQIAVALGVALVNESGKAADKVNTDLLACVVQSLCQRYIIVAVTAFANHGNRRYGNTLVDDGHAQLNFDILTGFYQMLCLAANLIINLLRCYLDIRMTAITQADAHGDSTHVQLILGNHARSF